MLDIEILVVWLHHLRKYVELSINLMFLNMKVHEEIKIETKIHFIWSWNFYFLRSLLSCLQLLTTGSVMKLSLAFLYSGLEVSFWAGVLPSSISFTQHLGHQRKSLMGLASIMISIGSMVGGLLLISFKDLVNKRGRNMVIIFGLVVHITAYILSFLYLAHLSPMGDTNQELFSNFSFITKRKEIIDFE